MGFLLVVENLLFITDIDAISFMHRMSGAVRVKKVSFVSCNVSMLKIFREKVQGICSIREVGTAIVVAFGDLRLDS